MRRLPRDYTNQSIPIKKSLLSHEKKMAFVLSGGGSRAAYQVGVLRALLPYLEKHNRSIAIVVGSSIGAVNGLVLSACLKNGIAEAVHQLDELWRARTYKNSFATSPSRAFLRAIKIASVQYARPGPHATADAIFDPSPMMQSVDRVITEHGGLNPINRAPQLEAVAVMTTVEGEQRRPMLFLSSHRRLEGQELQGASFEVCHVDELNARHGFASAALPSVLPPVEIDTEHGRVRLVDGGISQNVPVDPAVRLGAERVIVIDISGRSWWLDHFNEAHDTRPKWEVPAGLETFCMRPPETLVIKNIKPMGPILHRAVAGSRRAFIRAVGAVWPLFSLLKRKMGEDIAYEVMSYVALDPEYLHGVIESGYEETLKLLKDRSEVEFERPEDYKGWVSTL